MITTGDRAAFSSRTLLASAARTETGNGSAVKLPSHTGGIGFVCDLTAAATEVGDTLDVFVQTKIDGTNWLDVVHFTQMVGNGGALRYIAKVSAETAQAEFENGTALGAAAIRNHIGDEWRVRWAITDAGADNASFTFSVTAMVM